MRPRGGRPWARELVERAVEAEASIERGRRLAEAASRRASALRQPLPGGGRRPGPSAGFAPAADAAVDALADVERGAAYAGARAVLREFDALAAAVAPRLRGRAALGLAVACCRRRGMSVAEAARSLGVGRTTAYDALRALYGWLDGTYGGADEATRGEMAPRATARTTRW